MKLAVIICIVMWAKELKGQSGVNAINAGYLGTGTYSNTKTDVFCLNNNQAALARLERACAAIFSERKFNLAEISYLRFCAAVPVGTSKFGLTGTYYGSSIYHESFIGLAYATRMSVNVELGAQFNYYSVGQQANGNRAAPGFDLGAIFHAAKCNIGLQASNPLAGLLNSANSLQLPATFRLGMGYDVSGLLLLSLELVKKEKEPIDYRPSLEFQLTPVVYWRAGIASATSLIWMSAGFSLRQIRLDIIASHHPQLGLSPGVAIFFAGFKKSAS